MQTPLTGKDKSKKADQIRLKKRNNPFQRQLDAEKNRLAMAQKRSDPVYREEEKIVLPGTDIWKIEKRQKIL